MPDQLQSAPAVAVIDQNNVLTLNWLPYPYAAGESPSDVPFDDYTGWEIVAQTGALSGGVFTPSGLPQTFLKSVALNPGETPTSRIFTTILSAVDYGLTMQAEGVSGVNPSPFWEINGTQAPYGFIFPAAIVSSYVTFSNTTLLLNQQLTVTLGPGYTEADQWQILWPDGTSTGWIPLSASVVTKSFTNPGAQVVSIQARRNYTGSAYNPPVSLIRQLAVQIFVMDQEATTVSSSSVGLTTTLGFAGTSGFEIVNAITSTPTPQPWEVIARALVRDTITNELKMLLATSRFTSASSLLGTMALDVFPIEGRPKTLELLTPVEQEITGPNTETVPVKIQTTSLPNIIVGKSITDALGTTLAMSVQPNTGIAPYIWAASGLPNGVFMTSNGIINGTPLEMGEFEIEFSVQDSSTPFSIDEVALPILIETDMEVIIQGQPATNTDLGTAIVGTPFSLQMAVGNIVSSSTLPGGLAPYTWSTPAGALPEGLTINPTTGLIAGVPCTYNSTLDFVTPFNVVIQVTDAIGAKASNTFTMTLQPAALQFGPVNQPEIFASQTFKLVVPVFGGQSPYTLQVHTDDGASSPAATYSLVDGQVEIVLNIPIASSGVHYFTLTVADVNYPSSLPVTQQFSYRADVQICSLEFVSGFIHKSTGDPGAWTYSDSSSSDVIDLTGNLGNFVLLPFNPSTNPTVDPVTNGLTVVLNPAVSPATLVVNGPPTTFRNSELRVPLGLTYNLVIGAVTSGPFTASEKVVQTTSGASAYLVSTAPAGQPPVNNPPIGTTLSIGPITGIPDATDIWTGQTSSAVFTPTTAPVIFTPAPATVSRPYTLIAHNDSSNPGADFGLMTAYVHPYITGDAVGLNPRKPYYNSPDVFPDVIAPWTASVQVGSVLPPGLSLDANTGLIYGTVAGTFSGTSIVEYSDNSGILHGVVTINWAILSSDFTMNSSFSDGKLGTAYTTGSPLGTIGPAFSTLSSVSLVDSTDFPLPSGLSVTLDVSNLNVLVVGTPVEAGYFDVWFQITAISGQVCYVYKRIVVDYPIALTITTPSTLPNAIVAVPYIPANGGATMQAVGGTGGPYTWSLFSGSLPGGIVLNNAEGPGTFSGFASSATVSPAVVVIQVTDGISTVQGTFYLSVQVPGLVVSPLTPMVVTSGRPFSAILTASGDPLNTPYTWSISPLSSYQLPTGLTLAANVNPLTATVSGTTSATGFNETIIFRVTDSIGAYYDASIVVQVIAGLVLHAGPDYADSLSLGILGYVDQGNTDSIVTFNNQPFRVIATGVISTTPATISITTSNPNITADVDILDTVHGIAYIHLHGPFSSGASGSNPLTVTVVDSGVGVTQTFTWWVYNDGVFRIAPSTGSLPLQEVS
jgi:hypothetical protein